MFEVPNPSDTSKVAQISLLKFWLLFMALAFFQ